MNPTLLVTIFQAAVSLVSQLAPIVQEVKGQLSTKDQATLDTTLATLDEARQTAVGQAEADLEAAAKN